MKMNNVKGLVWDLDGTLLDSFGIFEQIIGDVVAESGQIMPSRDKILSNYHGSLEDTLKNILGIESVEELNETVNTFLEKQEHHYGNDLETHLFEDALALSQTAAKQGIRQILVTNRAHGGRGSASPKHIIAATSLVDSIHEVRPSDEVDYNKPDKRSLGGWLERNDLASTEIIVIGDQFVDAQLAINIGARAIIIKRNGNIPHLDSLTSQDNVMTVDNLEDIEFS